MIKNMTPHAINLITGANFDPTVRKYRGGDLVRVIEPSGTLLNAKMSEEDAGMVDGIPCKKSTIVSCDPLPEDTCEEEIFYIVSMLYLTAAKQSGFRTDHLLTIGAAVVDDAGRTIGAAFLNRN